MSMKKWAEREVELACKNDKCDEYMNMCAKSALKVYNVLLEEGYSGFSINITRSILNRLIDGKPLMPIEDTDDNWVYRYTVNNIKTYRCTRMSGLFKDVYEDGTIEYKDNNYCVGIDIDTGVSYTNGLVSKIVREMFPITMPYYPTKSIKVYTETFLTDKRNGDFDTRGIYYLIKPDGEKIEINRFFKSDDWLDKDWVELSEEEYNKRKENKIER